MKSIGNALLCMITSIFLTTGSKPLAAMEFDQVGKVLKANKNPGALTVLFKLYSYIDDLDELKDIVQMMIDKEIIGSRIWGAYNYIAKPQGDIQAFVNFIKEYDTTQGIETYANTEAIAKEALKIHWAFP